MLKVAINTITSKDQAEKFEEERRRQFWSDKL
jgi:hypothetical protein